jgi:acetyltransferase-like isoleucine patch superfamily enzyme
VLPRAVLGRDCYICDHVFIENDVVLGDRVTVKCGVQLWDGVLLEDDVFIGPNATFTNDPFPRSKQYPKNFGKTVVRRGASIGANATILPGISIGAKAMIGAGAVVTRDVPPGAIVVGNPGRIVGYTDSEEVGEPGPVAQSGPLPQGKVKGVALYRIPQFRDLRGSLSVLEHEKLLPFVPTRSFLVYDVPSQHVRGEHAHKVCHQFLVCVKGSCSVLTDDAEHRDEWRLEGPGVGLHVPPLIWAVEYKYSSDAVLLVFASHAYDADDYVRDYDEFLALVRT